MRIKKNDYLGLDHDKVCSTYEGDLIFVNYMCLRDPKDRPFVAAVYHAANPNRDKGHKEYMILFSHYDPVLMRRTYYVSGRTQEEINKDRIHNGVQCPGCQTVLVSLSDHDFVRCDCDHETFVAGGQHNSYTRVGGKEIEKIRNVEVDFLTNEVKVIDGKYGK